MLDFEFTGMMQPSSCPYVLIGFGCAISATNFVFIKCRIQHSKQKDLIFTAINMTLIIILPDFTASANFASQNASTKVYTLASIT
jgi:hypothetical protein